MSILFSCHVAISSVGSLYFDNFSAEQKFALRVSKSAYKTSSRLGRILGLITTNNCQFSFCFSRKKKEKWNDWITHLHIYDFKMAITVL